MMEEQTDTDELLNALEEERMDASECIRCGENISGVESSICWEDGKIVGRICCPCQWDEIAMNMA